MLNNIIVDCSPFTNTLRVGRVGKNRTHLLEWENREGEILCAVRGHLMTLAEDNGSNTCCYEWTRAYGKSVELRVTIKDGANNG